MGRILNLMFTEPIYSRKQILTVLTGLELGGTGSESYFDKTDEDQNLELLLK